LPKLPVVSSKEAIKALEHLGFQVYRQTGSHIHLWNKERNLVVTVPNHTELVKGHIDINHEAGQAGERGVHLCTQEVKGENMADRPGKAASGQVVRVVVGLSFSMLTDTNWDL